MKVCCIMGQFIHVDSIIKDDIVEAEANGFGQLLKRKKK